jgi:hypothetical protein
MNNSERGQTSVKLIKQKEGGGGAQSAELNTREPRYMKANQVSD